ncbi:MAG TPA: A/G-specific adenine glycosylase, partial [Thermoanaerobaculia bacterium]|nr:A/G-specific adenine glycosylase [Thermoanaerobaculia bacterium]
MPSQPVTRNPQPLARAIERWFLLHRRPLPWREHYEPYEVWVSEVMLQQTRMEVVLGGYYERFLTRFPDVQSLARATDDEVMAQWSGLGYYRRARMLRDGAIDVVSRFGGVVPRRADELLTISGIGRYTAGAIASIAHDERAPIVDGNVARILARVEALEAPLGTPALLRDAWVHAKALVDASASPRNLNQGLMELGALVCKPQKPLCLLCPIRRHCAAFAQGRVDDLPRPKAKQATRALSIPLYLIVDGAGRVLMRREAGKLMNAMFHLPHGDASLLGGTPLRPRTGAILGSFRHTVTTRRIEFSLYAATLRGRA